MRAENSSCWRSRISSEASCTPGRPTLEPSPARSYAQVRVVRARSRCVSRQSALLPPNPASSTIAGLPEPAQVR